MTQQLTIIGVMSGTSLDGIDLCCVSFRKTQSEYEFQILESTTFQYTENLEDKLRRANSMSQDELDELDKTFGNHIGKMVYKFIRQFKLEDKVDLIASHGHTIFHEPAKGFTYQIGNGEEIAKATGIPTINDFRSRDVELGGQGAPLVPIGDKLLFDQYESCLNLGGFANISFEYKGKRIAFDISPANLPLNNIVKEHFGLSYDKNGEKAKSGNCISKLKSELNSLEFYKQNHPKSLGVEWLNDHFYPLINRHNNESVIDLLRTILEHETDMIANALKKYKIKSCLVTGGGAYNEFFIEILMSKCVTEIILPETKLIEFKEALIFAFLGFLHHNNQINTLSSVTGATRDSKGGVLHTP